MPTSILSAALVGIEALPVEIESDVSNGLPAFVIVGLPDASVQEARERVKTALKNSGCGFPKTRLTVNLAPADVRKNGPGFDLPIAVAIMLGSGEIGAEAVHGAMFLGELALDGTVRRVCGALPAALLAKRVGCARMYVPDENAAEAALVEGLEVFGVGSLSQLSAHLRGVSMLAPKQRSQEPYVEISSPDFADIAGARPAKRALEIAAAGGHNVLLSGSPGAGKTLLARALPSILPPLSAEESLEATAIASVAGLSKKCLGLVSARPWRAPHHSASGPAIIGGGPLPKPGEVTLAHRGVLFLDEFPEFSRTVLESLRQPLEDRVVIVSRAQGSCHFPASFMLIAARNPCPCGYYGDPERACDCPEASRARYLKKISGPLLDRIDLYVDVPRTPYRDLASAGDAEPSYAIRARVVAARALQSARFDATERTNAEMRVTELRTHCRLSDDASKLFEEAVERLKLSPRSAHRCLKVARTIADLDGRVALTVADIGEALQYRPRHE